VGHEEDEGRNREKGTMGESKTVRKKFLRPPKSRRGLRRNYGPALGELTVERVGNDERKEPKDDGGSRRKSAVGGKEAWEGLVN